uniref:Uncharacterized protein n=1 Tax=Arundo donax TaxID=35708 RepID=A0A0A9B6C0_ARUDO
MECEQLEHLVFAWRTVTFTCQIRIMDRDQTATSYQPTGPTRPPEGLNRHGPTSRAVLPFRACTLLFY